MFGDPAAGLYQQAPTEAERPIFSALDILHTMRQVVVKRTLNPSWTAVPSTKSLSYYSIYNNAGEEIFYAVERSHVCSRNCCSDLRDFELIIHKRDSHQEVLKIRRYIRTDCCFCPWCMQSMEVFTMPDGAMMGTISQNWAICRPKFQISLPSGEILFRILGPCCTMRCCVKELNFDVRANNSWVRVALISHEWNAYIDYENSELFGVDFEQELDARMKALILSTSFLVNALYYKD